MGIISFDISLYILMFLSRSCNFGLFYFCLFLLQDTRAVRIFDRRVSSYSSDVYLFFFLAFVLIDYELVYPY